MVVRGVLLIAVCMAVGFYIVGGFYRLHGAVCGWLFGTAVYSFMLRSKQTLAGTPKDMIRLGVVFISVACVLGVASLFVQDYDVRSIVRLTAFAATTISLTLLVLGLEARART